MKLIFIKIFFKLLSILMVISIASLAFIYYLLSSERGAKLVFAFSDNYLQENFSLSIDFDSVTGTLVEGLAFNELNLQHPSFSLQGQTLESAWSLWSLFNKELNLQTLKANNLVITQFTQIDDSQDSQSDISTTIGQIFGLPLSININSLELNNPQIILAQQSFGLGSLNASLSLDEQAFQINNFSISDSNYTLAGSVALQASDLLLDGNLDWTYQSAASQTASIDAYSGALFFSGDIENLDISHNLIEPLQVQSDGNVSTGLLSRTGLNFSFEHSVEDVIDFLPLPEMLTSIEGSLLTHGSPELIFIDADLELQTLEFLPINLLVSGEYQGQSISFETVSIISPEIDLQLVTDIDLQDLSLEADWRLNYLVLDNYLDSFELQNINGGGSLSVNANGNADLNLSFLTGTLNNYELEASGQIEVVENSLSAINLELNTGQNRIALEGSMENQLDINWQITAPDLSIWLPNLSGNIAGNGLLNGDLNNPEISGTLQVNTLEYLDDDIRLKLENLQATIATQQDNYQFNISLAGLLTESAGTELEISESQINISGNLSGHEGDLALINDNLELGFNFAGSYADENWQGNMLSAQINSDYGLWQLQNSMGLSLTRNTVNITPHCWSYLQTSLCLDADINEEEILLNTDITDFPLSYLNTEAIITQINSTELNAIFANKPLALAELQDSLSLYLPANSYMQGILNAQLELRADSDALQDADFMLNLQPENFDLNLFLPQESDTQSVQPEIRSFSIESNALMLSRNNGNLSTNADINIFHQESSGLNVQGDLNFLINMDRDRNLQGTVALDFPNINWLETLLPEIRNTQGELAGQLELLGSFDQPRFISDLKLTNGSFELPEYGINPEQIFIDFISDDQQNLQIVASAKSGSGDISFTGQAASLNNSSRTFQLTLMGENFELVNNEGTRIAVSPDVALNFNNNVLDIQGKVYIPELEIDIRENGTILVNNGTDVSRDVIIVNAPPEQSELLSSNQSSNLQEIPITANLELELGDNVRFQGLGLDLILSGNLQAQQDINRPLLVYGDISISEGFYEIYGQRLTVSNGKLVFFGNPANPALDIRANRQGSNVQAGVQINGTLRNMQSQLFSTPTLPDSEILSILITGKSFANTNDQEQGNLLGAVASLGINRSQGLTNTIRSELGLDMLALNSSSNIDQSSIGLGKYLTPDIFMHYEIGLFESKSTLSLEYILTQRLRLEVESGISQSIDMTYTVEK